MKQFGILKRTVLKTDTEGDSFAECTFVFRLARIGLEGVADLGRLQGDMVFVTIQDEQAVLKFEEETRASA